MTDLLVSADTWLLRLDRFLAAMASLCILAMMLLTSLDVVMRYGFDQPLSWVYDVLTFYILPAAFFLGFSFALRMNHHITVDIFAKMLPQDIYHAAMSVGCLAAAGIFGAIAWFGAHDTLKAWTNDEVAFGTIVWPLWIGKAVVPAGMLPLALRCVHRGIAHAVCRGEPEAQARLGLRIEQAAGAEA